MCIIVAFFTFIVSAYLLSVLGLPDKYIVISAIVIAIVAGIGVFNAGSSGGGGGSLSEGDGGGDGGGDSGTA